MITRRTIRLQAPLNAAFVFSAIVLAACQSEIDLAEHPAETCSAANTPITEIQGEGEFTPMLGQEVTTAGVVTHINSDGVFIEQPAASPHPSSSRGLFVQYPGLETRVVRGDYVTITGTVVELGEKYDTLTALTDVAAYGVCQSGNRLPVTRVALPLDESGLEPLEGMNLVLEQSLVVTDTRYAGQGKLTLSLDGMLPIATEVARPGADAREQSARNRGASIKVTVPDGYQDMAAGATIVGIAGVLDHDGYELRLEQSAPLNMVPVRVFRIDPPLGKDIRVLGLNLHNYFNGDGQGGGFPTARGASRPAEFERQRQRLTATISFIQPHVVGVMELENDGFGPGSAAQDFILDLEQATASRWQVVSSPDGRIGDDLISVGIFYQPDRVSPAGPPSILTGPAFDGLSRQPLAVNFLHSASGEPFVVVVNHLKSKGSCPDEGRNANLRDGQGCWNQARTDAARAMAGWVLKLANSQAQGKGLILGDLNAYRLEDPVTAIIEAGFNDLTAPSAMQPAYSFIYSGEAGTLDYAFATRALLPFVHSARILNINSPYADGVDLPLPFLRSSDHDPVVVDLRFLKSETFD